MPHYLINIVVKDAILPGTLNGMSLDLLRSFLYLLGSSLYLLLIAEDLIQDPALNLAGLVLRGPSLLCRHNAFLLAIL